MSKSNFIGLVLSALVLGACSAARPQVVAHRGGAALAPENTLAALERALALGVECVEIDLRRSADGVVVLFHDESLERTSDGAGPLAERSLAELAALDVGAWKDASFAGQRVPTLEQALRLCRGRTQVMLDVKVAGLGSAVRDALERSRFERERLWIGTWDDEQLADLRAALPEVRHAFIGEAPEGVDRLALEHWLDGLVERGYEALSLNWKKLPARCVEFARGRGLKVFVWTLNDAAPIEAAYAQGVDGVITDRPDLAQQVRDAAR